MDNLLSFNHNGWRFLYVARPQVALPGAPEGMVQVVYSKVIGGSEQRYFQPMHERWIEEGGQELENALIGAGLMLDRYEAGLQGG